MLHQIRKDINKTVFLLRITLFSIYVEGICELIQYISHQKIKHYQSLLAYKNTFKSLLNLSKKNAEFLRSIYISNLYILLSIKILTCFKLEPYGDPGLNSGHQKLYKKGASYDYTFKNLLY